MALASTHELSAIDPAAIATLRNRLSGPVSLAGAADYDERRSIWNGMIDRRPALIVQPANRADVQEAVRFAREQSLPVSIKSGGHNVAGHAVTEGGVMLDLSGMRDVTIDPVRRRAYVGGGALWRDVDRATAEHGLATTGGVISSTGVAGLTLGGGIGWLVGEHGMSIDNLCSVTLVTADGDTLTASDEQYSDLFWAVRGGGGNFGVATSFEFALHPVDQVLAGFVAWPVSDAPAVLEFYRGFVETAPDELGAYAQLFTDSETGARLVAIALFWSGDLAEGERIIEPVRRFGAPLVDMIGPMPYVDWQQAFDTEFPHGRRYYWKGNLHRTLTDQVLAGMVEFGTEPPIPHGTVVIEWYRGAMNRVDAAATAFAHRDAEFQIVCIGAWNDPADDAAGIAWTRGAYAATGEGALNGAFLNFNSADADRGDATARVRAAYGQNWDRLVAIKRRYDPGNLFRENNNIP